MFGFRHGAFTILFTYCHMIQSNDFRPIHFHGTTSGDSPALGKEAFGDEGLTPAGGKLERVHGWMFGGVGCIADDEFLVLDCSVRFFMRCEVIMSYFFPPGFIDVPLVCFYGGIRGVKDPSAAFHIFHLDFRTFLEPLTIDHLSYRRYHIGPSFTIVDVVQRSINNDVSNEGVSISNTIILPPALSTPSR